jgi:rhamnulose-1-phosphate aldolase
MELISNNQALNDIILEVSEIAGYLWQRGWAERNAGNISVNITHLIGKQEHKLGEFPFFELPGPYPGLSHGYFFVSGTGKRMRDLAREPMLNALIIHLDENGSGYRIISKDKSSVLNFRPTSELPTHLGIHDMIARRGTNEKVVIHTHANELVALTQIKEFCNQENLNKLLWGMHPETIVFVPGGVGFVPYVTPGTEEIATETLKVLEKFNVALWEKHGVFAIGETVFDTFDMIDILGKAARIYFLVKSSGHEPEGLSDEQLAILKELAANF